MKTISKKRSFALRQQINCVLGKQTNQTLTRGLFTLIELVVSMAVLAVLMMIMMSFFSAAQQSWTASSARSQVYDNARIAMDLISRDLQCAMYTENNATAEDSFYAFWHESNSRINFISATTMKPDAAISSVCEIKYARSDGTFDENDLAAGTLLPAGWLLRSVTGDDSVDSNDSANKANDANKYNFSLFSRNTAGPDRAYRIWKEISPGKPSFEPFRRVIPYVVDLKFTCYGFNSSTVYNMVDHSDYSIPNTGVAAITTPLPFCIQIELTLMDRSSWIKWQVLDGANVADPSSEAITSAAYIYRQNHQRKFTKMVFLGNRNI